MTYRRLILIFASLAALALPTPASADAPPIKDGVICTQQPKASYRISAVARHGMPIKITCTGPASFFAVPQFSAGSPQDGDLLEMFGHGIPAVSSVKKASMDAAGTVTVRPRLRPFAIKIARRYAKTKVRTGLGTMREDGRFWSEPGDWSGTVLVRR